MKNITIIILFIFFNLTDSFAQNKCNCDTTVFYSIINEHFRDIYKHSNAVGYLLNINIVHENDTIRDFPISICSGLSTLDTNLIIIKKGRFAKEYRSDTGMPIYTIYSLKTNSTHDLFRLKFSVGVTIGGHVYAYTYKKKKKTWKLVNRNIVEIWDGPW
jgi:hypothetical protein